MCVEVIVCYTSVVFLRHGVSLLAFHCVSGMRLNSPAINCYEYVIKSQLNFDRPILQSITLVIKAPEVTFVNFYYSNRSFIYSVCYH